MNIKLCSCENLNFIMLPITQHKSLYLPNVKEAIGMNYIYTHSTEFPEKHFNYGLSNNQCCITNFLNSELLSPLKWTTRQHMNRLQYGSIIIVLHVTQILHSNIRSYPWSMLQAVVSLNWSCFLCKYARTRHIRSPNHVCVCVSHSVSPLQLVNQWVTFTKPGISQWRPPHFMRSHDQY